MFSKLLLTFSIALCALHVHAQSSAAAPAPTSASQIPPCVLTCTSTAATTAGCTSLTDTKCLCTSKAFQDASAQCIQSKCAPADQAAALQLQQATCGSMANSSAPAGAPNGTASAAGAGSTASAAAGNGSAAASGAAPAASASGSAAAKSAAFKTVDLGMDHLVGLVGVLAAIMGGVGVLV